MGERDFSKEYIDPNEPKVWRQFKALSKGQKQIVVDLYNFDAETGEVSMYNSFLVKEHMKRINRANPLDVERWLKAKNAVADARERRA